MISSYELSQALGLDLKESKLLKLALTHKSKGWPHNERLEFLGDAILSFIITSELYQRFPKLEEGVLSRLRSNLVKGETLAKLAQELNLGEHLLLGIGELKSGGHHRQSILADTFEAVIGALYLERGLDVTRERILAWYGDAINNVNLVQAEKDPKTLLQEWLQAKGDPLPEYSIVAVQGEPHEQTFTVTCSAVGLKTPTQGRGNSRRQAEQFSAQKALEQLYANK